MSRRIDKRSNGSRQAGAGGSCGRDSVAACFVSPAVASLPHLGNPAPPPRRGLRPAGRAARASGFSLIEVLAAIMLLAITSAALMKVVGGSISLTQNAAGYSEAAMWARSALDSAFVGESIRLGSTSGQFNADYRWAMVVTPWSQAGNPPPNSPMHLYLLDLDVLWGPPQHPRSAHFRTLRLAGSEDGSQLQGAP